MKKLFLLVAANHRSRKYRLYIEGPYILKASMKQYSELANFLINRF